MSQCYTSDYQAGTADTAVWVSTVPCFWSDHRRHTTQPADYQQNSHNANDRRQAADKHGCSCCQTQQLIPHTKPLRRPRGQLFAVKSESACVLWVQISSKDFIVRF